MNTKESKAVKKVHLTNFHIAGFGFWEGCEAFSKLKIGTRLELVREPVLTVTANAAFSVR